MSDKETDIINATISLLNKEGVGVSTARIAKAAGVSNGTLFNYFPTKQELLDAVFLKLKARISDIFEDIDLSQSLEDMLRQYWRHYFNWARAHNTDYKAMHLLLESGLVSADVQKKVNAGFQPALEIIAERVHKGEVRDLDVPYLMNLFSAQLRLAIISELNEEKSLEAFDIFWRGVQP